jgi:glycerol-3-phosphate dehydrogenase subunit B
MTAPKRIKHDLVVIGSGLAGMAAAVFAVNRGISTAIVGSMGEAWFTSGAIDLMGVHPVESGRRWNDPWAAIDALRRDLPGHPYAKLSNATIRTAVGEFLLFLNEAGLPYRTGEEGNLEIVTAFGSIKTTHAVPQTMWPGVAAFSLKAPCLAVGLQGLKGFSARLMSERLKTAWPDLRHVSLPPLFDGLAQEISPLPLAGALETPEFRARLAGLIEPHLKDAGFVALPAVLGVNQAHRVLDDLAERLGRPAFEVPAMPPSIPGIRLKETLIRGLAEKGVRCLFQKQVLRAERRSGEGFSVEVGQADVEVRIRSKGIVMATGRFMGGGLRADRNRIKETLFGLPVVQPDHRDDWHADGFFDPAGHAVNRAGIETDALARPLASDGRPAIEGLFAAGTILAHQDWTRMKCGSGLSLATAWQAVEGFIQTGPPAGAS